MAAYFWDFIEQTQTFGENVHSSSKPGSDIVRRLFSFKKKDHD